LVTHLQPCSKSIFVVGASHYDLYDKPEYVDQAMKKLEVCYRQRYSYNHTGSRLNRMKIMDVTRKHEVAFQWEETNEVAKPSWFVKRFLVGHHQRLLDRIPIQYSRLLCVVISFTNCKVPSVQKFAPPPGVGGAGQHTIGTSLTQVAKCRDIEP
jgi:hypothetical protein